MGTVWYWQTFWSTIGVRFTGQCWYFNPLWTVRRAMNRGELCVEQQYLLKVLRSCYVSTYKSGFWKCVGGEGGPFWLHKETLIFMGPAAYQNTGWEW